METNTPLIKSEEIFTHSKNKKLYTLSRWAALYESINMIADKAEEKKIPFEDIELKPLKIGRAHV